MSAIDDIAAERRRQIEVEGFDDHHDDEHPNGELALAAACYASPYPIFRKFPGAAGGVFMDPWPWSDGFDNRYRYGSCREGSAWHRDGRLPNPATYTVAERRDLLVKAGALIAAEIDRLDRANPKPAFVATDEKINKLLDMTRFHEMTAAEKWDQRVSFVRGTLMDTAPGITREQVEAVATEIYGPRPADAPPKVAP